MALARGVLIWERAWPVLVPVAAPVFLVVVAGLFGVWSRAPAWAHWAALVAAIIATGAALIRFGPRFSPPTRREALARLEEDGWLRHNPLQALEDRPFAASEGGVLWRAHLVEMRRRSAGARLKGPRANADVVDRWSLRFAAPGLLAVALVAAGADRDARLATAFAPGAAFASRTALVDLWIEPPAYTGKAPLFLLRAGEALAGTRRQIDAPRGSLVVAQASNARRMRLVLDTDGGDVNVDGDASGRASVKLEESGLVRLRAGAAEGRWPIGVVYDNPPTAEFIEPLSTTDDARLAVAMRTGDDYGIVAARLFLRLNPDQERPLDAPGFDETAVREIRAIDIDGIAGKPGERRFDLDLQADPWAGLEVLARIVVTDGAGQTGETAEVAARLPARPFFNPLARAVIEQRQTLAVAARNWPRAGRSFDALTLGPEQFYDDSTDYLLIRTAFWRVMRQGGEDFKETVAEFWPLALQLEDEALELARRRLEAAQDALRQALERGASDSEIARLVEELRAAMQQYLQALAESGQAVAGGGQQGEMLSESDLDEMLDAIRNLAQSGARNAARQALSDLENLLNNLRLSSQGGGQGAGGQGQTGEGQGGAAGQTGDLIGRQRDLANRSFERGQTFGGTGDDLADEEDGLAGDLSDLIDQLRSGASSPDPEGGGARALGEALRSMKDAEAALRRDNFDAAVTAMEEAIASLRAGAEKLAEAQGAQDRQQMGEGSGPSLDPLGRPIGDAYGRGVDVPEGTDAQRARDVLEELRKRLSDGKRGEDEVKYLERLLDWF